MRQTVAIALAVIVATSCGGDSGTTVDSDRPSDSVSATSVTVATDDTAPVTTVTDGVAGLELGQVGFTTGVKYERVVVSAAAEVSNTSDAYVSDIEWSATLVDASGSTVSEAHGTWVGPLGPGQKAWIVPEFRIEVDATPVELQVNLLAAKQITTFTVENASLPPQDVVIEPLSAKTYLSIIGDVHVEAAFRNTSAARLTKVMANCGVYVDDSLIGGAYGFINELLPGGEAGLDTTSRLIVVEPLPTDVRCGARPVNISTYEPGAIGSGLVVQAGMTVNTYDPAGDIAEFYDVNLGVTLFNPTDQVALGVQVEVDMLDSQGRFVHLSSPATGYVLPGETVYTGISAAVGFDSDPPATLRARVSVDEWGDPTAASLGFQEGLDLTAYPFEVSGVSTYIPVTYLEFVGTVTNLSAVDIEDAVIGCVALKAGVPVGGAYRTLGLTPANVGVPVEIVSSTGALSYDDLRCTVHLTSISELG